MIKLVIIIITFILNTIYIFWDCKKLLSVQDIPKGLPCKYLKNNHCSIPIFRLKFKKYGHCPRNRCTLFTAHDKTTQRDYILFTPINLLIVTFGQIPYIVSTLLLLMELYK